MLGNQKPIEDSLNTIVSRHPHTVSRIAMLLTQPSAHGFVTLNLHPVRPLTSKRATNFSRFVISTKRQAFTVRFATYNIGKRVPSPRVFIPFSLVSEACHVSILLRFQRFACTPVYAYSLVAAPLTIADISKINTRAMLPPLCIPAKLSLVPEPRLRVDYATRSLAPASGL